MEIPVLTLKWLDDFPKKPPTLQSAGENVWKIEVMGIRVQVFAKENEHNPNVPVYGFSLWGLSGQLHLEPRHGYDQQEALQAAMLTVDWVNNGKRGAIPYKSKLQPQTRQEDYEPDYDDMEYEEDEPEPEPQRHMTLINLSEPQRYRNIHRVLQRDEDGTILKAEYEDDD